MCHGITLVVQCQSSLTKLYIVQCVCEPILLFSLYGNVMNGHSPYLPNHYSLSVVVVEQRPVLPLWH